MEKIDFVLTWVDGDDPNWKAEKLKYEGKPSGEEINDDSNAECRYRSDTDLLRYWFRAVEQFAPWVNKIHFVTCGQKPGWLNENHPQLNLVSHQDYIPFQYLPTFNANTIEMNFHRIEGLSDHFVYFNDDIFLLRPVNEDFFFKQGNPVLDTTLKYTNRIGYNGWSRLMFNDYCIVNKDFDISASIWSNRKKWFCIKELGYRRARRNFMCYLANKTLPVGFYGHVALPHLKSSLVELWDLHPDIMEQSSAHKFRSDDQVNQWLLCAWDQAKGMFYPAHEGRLGRNVTISSDRIGWACKLIKKQEIPQICVNDTYINTDFDYCMKELVKAFDSILPTRSGFEKY